ncbi:hypothetical protein B0H16DRAFT_1334240 [Mycena metata]|uniref:Uncharacterized protein n=1 Tax=Mycena metata TaxID=1033252 RepID=A0AAD7MLN5_9AGAR|nr:hypothetical protein B0H16DRAFT_1334240 [Mycena metata]
MKEPYNTSYFHVHTQSPCSPPPPPSKAVSTIGNFFTATTTANVSKPKARPEKVPRPCSGLTAAYHAQVGLYLDRTPATGGGAKAPEYYSEKLFKKEHGELNDVQKEQVLTAQFHDRTWRNDTSPGVMATFSTKCLMIGDVAAGSATATPCPECRLLLTARNYQNAINKPASEPKNLRFVPHIHQNKHAGMLYARFQGLEALIAEENVHSLEKRYIIHVLNGDFKDDKVFNGIIEAKILGKAREIKGMGNQNFKHNEDVDAVFGLVHSISPRAYRELAKHIPLRTERSIKYGDSP